MAEKLNETERRAIQAILDASTHFQWFRGWDNAKKWTNPVTGEVIEKASIVESAVDTANKHLEKDIVYNLPDAIEVLQRVVAQQGKVKPETYAVSKLIKVAKDDIGVRGEQLDKLTNYLNIHANKEIVISASGLTRASEKVGLTQDQIVKLKEKIPQGPFQVESEEISTEKDQSKEKSAQEVALALLAVGLADQEEIFIPAETLPATQLTTVPHPPPPIESEGFDVAKATTRLAAQGVVSAIKGPQGMATTLLIRNKKKVAAMATGLIFGAGLMIAGAGAGAITLGAIGAGAIAYTAGTAGGMATLASLGSGVLTGMASVLGSGFGAIGIGIGTGIVALPITVAIIMFIINSGAYVVPPGSNLTNTITAGGGSIISPFIDVQKTANPAGPFENGEVPGEITYTITVTAKKGTLTNISFQNICQVIKEGSSGNCDAPNPTDIPETIDPGTPYKFIYKQNFSTPDYYDSFITDTFIATADTPEKQGVSTSGYSTIKIGTPPEDCPSGWPVIQGQVTVGAGVPGLPTHGSYEAIDIGSLPQGNPVHATHSGIVQAISQTTGYGRYVKIESTCNGIKFISIYGHLSVIEIQSGTHVTAGQEIGLSGNTGNSSGPHLHYEFRLGTLETNTHGILYPNKPPYMWTPYIPKDIPRGCGYLHCGVLIP